MTPQTDIVIAVHSRTPYDTREYFKECIRTLQSNTTNFRPIFVDDFCDPEGRLVLQEVAGRFTNSHTIRTEKQRWFTRAYNLGLRLVRTPMAVLLNIDTVLGEGWLEELYKVKAEAEAAHGRVGIIGSEYSAEEGRSWQNITSPTFPGNPGYVTAHCILVDMQAMYECSADRGTSGIYLDETQQAMIHIRSDNEISYRMQKLGWTTVRSFKSQCGHHGGKSWGHRLDIIANVRLENVND